MEADLTKSTVYFDGSCPLCRAEIGYYRRQDQADGLCFVDISAAGAVTPKGLIRQQATEWFHVGIGDGRSFWGAAAFVDVRNRLPGWRWAARGAALPGALSALESGYCMFLPVRSFISGLSGRVVQRKVVGDGADRG